MLSWTSRAATGFPARISQDPRSAMGWDHADYPLQVLLRCPGLSSAEPFSWSTLYSWQQSRTTWLPGLFPVIPSLGVWEMSGEAGRIQLLLVHSVACLSLSVETGLRVDQASAPPAEACSTSPSSPEPLPKITDELARQRNMEGSHSAGSAFVSATKQPVKLLELMRRSCSSDFCLCT